MPTIADARALTPDEKRRLARWLTQKVGGRMRPCAVCGTNDWAIGDHLVAPPRFQGGTFDLTGPVYAFAMLTCQNCSNTHFVSAVAAGVTPAGDDDESEGGDW